MLITQNHNRTKPTTKKFMGINSASLVRANEYAASKRSYVYPIYESAKRKGFNTEPIHIGYGVPE